MASTRKPSIVLVPGAWHQPLHYKPLTSRLEKAGYQVHAIDMPSVGDNLSATSGKEDVVAIRSQIEQLSQQGQDVVVVVHSRGGLPGGDAAEGLSKVDRQAQGKPGGVVRMVYMCAFAAPEGVSVYDATGGKPDEWIEDDGDIALPTRMAEIFYNDCSAEVVEAQVKHLRKLARSAFTTKATYSAWKHIPSTYLVCEKDNAIPLVAQEAMISHPEAKFTVERCAASHSPFLSMPDFTAEVVRRAAGEQI